MGQNFFGVKLRHCQLRKYVHGDVACSGLPWCSVWVPQIRARWYAWAHLHRIIRENAGQRESRRNPPKEECAMHSQDRCRLPSEGIVIGQMPLAS